MSEARRHLSHGPESLVALLALARRMRRYQSPDLLVVDEVGYLAASQRDAELLFEIVQRRYQAKSTVLTTNKVFKEWNEMFPSAGCVVTLIDRLVHKAEIVTLRGESYRRKEAEERTALKARERASRAKRPKGAA